LDLHDRGLWVVPCKGKKAIVDDWNEKRVSREELRRWLEGTHLNIAIVLNQSDCIDVECDTPEAESNLQNLFNGKIPPTPTWKSMRGLHRLFRRPSDDLVEKAVIHFDQIEFRGMAKSKGACSVLPPSVHSESGERYEWLAGLSLDDVEPAELATEIVDRLRNEATAETAADGEIKEGARNDTLFKKACGLRDLKLPAETVTLTLLDLNERLCKPPLPEAEVLAIVKSAMNGEAKPKTDFVTLLLNEVDLWHDENDDPFVTLPQREHRENWLIGKRARSFRRWLSKRFYDSTGQMISAGDLADVASLLEGKAVFDGPRHPLFRRTAFHEGCFYLDLCDPDWNAIQIDAEGWRPIADPPVKFRRAKAMHSLPIPIETPGTDLKGLLRPFLNVHESQWPLVAMWLVAALRPRGPYPILKLFGEQGSAKTTSARVCRSLIDPNAAPVRAEPRDCRDLMIAANNGWAICLDNLSVVKPDLSDALCRLSTGGGFATRTLYTDDEETIFDAMRPVILTSIEEIATRSDLLERSLIIDLPPLEEGARRAEEEFWREFETVRPRILGALLDVVSGAMRRLPEIERRSNANLSRMADFEQWGEAAEESLGLEPGTFAEAYLANREAATQTALESSPLIAALLAYVKKTPKVEDTATNLLEKLGHIDTKLTEMPGWPKTPRVLSQIFKRVAPNLRQVGIVVTQGTRGGGQSKEKIWRIEKPGEPTPLPPKPAPKIKPRINSGLAERLRALATKNGQPS
jgi:Bifunctional DNA primase/polymerase, N-terminal/Primase C terminal 1 (PriCT-1)